MPRIAKWFVLGIGVLTLTVTCVGAAPARSVAGIGVWNSGGRVSTLEMVGLNPQPEPPSRTAIAIYTSGAAVVRIALKCATTPSPNRFVATGRGTDGLWYLVTIVTARGAGQPDRVGVTPVGHPPSPCAESPTVAVTVGRFAIR